LLELKHMLSQKRSSVNDITSRTESLRARYPRMRVPPSLLSADDRTSVAYSVISSTSGNSGKSFGYHVIDTKTYRKLISQARSEKQPQAQSQPTDPQTDLQTEIQDFAEDVVSDRATDGSYPSINDKDASYNLCERPIPHVSDFADFDTSLVDFQVTGQQTTDKGFPSTGTELPVPYRGQSFRKSSEMEKHHWPSPNPPPAPSMKAFTSPAMTWHIDNPLRHSSSNNQRAPPRTFPSIFTEKGKLLAPLRPPTPPQALPSDGIPAKMQASELYLSKDKKTQESGISESLLWIKR
jgi:hypothetical protein